MFIPKLKVKPKRTKHVQVCALELTAMLSCWAAAGDTANSGACAEAAKRLHECMSKPGPKGKPHKSSINYHLARL